MSSVLTFFRGNDETCETLSEFSSDIEGCHADLEGLESVSHMTQGNVDTSKMSPQERVVFEGLYSTRVLIPTDLNLASSSVLSYLKPIALLMEIINANSHRLTRCLSKVTGDSVGGCSALTIWLQVTSKLSLLGNFTEHEISRVKTAWRRIFMQEKKICREVTHLKKFVTAFQRSLQRHIKVLLLKDDRLLCHFKTFVPPHWADIAEEVEEVSSEEKNGFEESEEVRATATLQDFIVVTETKALDTVHYLKFSGLKSEAQCHFVCQFLAGISLFLDEIFTELNLGKTLYSSQVPLTLPILKQKALCLLGPFDHLLLTFGIKCLLESHAQNALAYSALQTILVDFHVLMDVVREGFKKRVRHNARSRTISRLLADFGLNSLHFQLKNWTLRKSLLMRSICAEFVSAYGQTLEGNLRSGREKSFNGDESKAMVLQLTRNDPMVHLKPSSVEETVTRFCQDFAAATVDRIVSMLRTIQLPKASLSTLAPPPVGFLEGLCHLVVVAAAQLKLSKRHRKFEGEPLRKLFLNATTTMANLSKLARVFGTDRSKKLEPTLNMLETEADSTLQQVYGQEWVDLKSELPIDLHAQSLQASWISNEKISEDPKNFTVQWDPATKVVAICDGANGERVKFEQISLTNQISIFKTLLAQAIQTVKVATRSSQDASQDLKEAKRKLAAFCSYLTQIEKMGELRPEEKSVLLSIFRANLHSAQYLETELIRTLKRCRVSLSYAIWHIRIKLGQLNNLQPNGNSKGNPFGYGFILVTLPRPNHLILSAVNHSVPELTSAEKTLFCTRRFFERFTFAVKEVSAAALSSLVTSRDLFCGPSHSSPSKVNGMMLLLAQTISNIANFRDCPQFQRSLIFIGISQLLEKLDKLLPQSPVQQKLKAEVEATEAEIDEIYKELLVSMSSQWITDLNESTNEKLENNPDHSGTQSLPHAEAHNFWILKLDCDSRRVDLVLTFKNTKLLYSDLSRAKQGRVVIEMMCFLKALIDQVIVSLQSAHCDMNQGTKRLQTLKVDLKNFLKKENSGAELNLLAAKFIKHLNHGKTIAALAFNQINADVLSARMLLQSIKLYMKIRVKLEVPLILRLTVSMGDEFRKRKRWRRRGFESFQNEQKKQMQKKLKRKVRRIEVLFETGLMDVKSIQVPLKLNME